ncbi:MAG TPA: hypothetical protein VN673_18355 [Clostridia bacterium]|nr:hypothetical protein [Clostridia bacterium]
MASTTIAIVSDIHYACEAEQARGEDYEYQGLHNPLLRLLLRFHRHHIWLRQPLQHNHLLDAFLNRTESAEYCIANGDYTCNTGFAGVSDAAACESVRQCLSRLRARFGDKFRATFGDHELGKVSLCGNQGRMCLTSWQCACNDLGLEPFWRLDLGVYTLIGVVSSLIALPVFEPDTVPEERPRWAALREEHMHRIRDAFAGLAPEQRVLLFCHDPTALPFLWREEAVRQRLGQIEQTTIGHLHSSLIFNQARLLSGMPRITFLGHTAKKLSSALREARLWRPFKVKLCPSLAGIELLKDGGFCTMQLDPSGAAPGQFGVHRIAR